MLYNQVIQRSEMMEKIFKNEGIDCFGCVPFSECIVKKAHLLPKRESFNPRGVVCYAIPYYVDGNDIISSYAKSFDYHILQKQLGERLCDAFSKKFPEYSFFAYSDISPIDEVSAAIKGGMGFLGKNGLLITEKYSSFVFIGEIITDMPFENKTFAAKTCEGCGKCISACPYMSGKISMCISALTQKKGNLTEEEKKIIKKYGNAWGCDICQNVCPHTKKAIECGSIYTKISFFKENRINSASSEQINAMSDAEFSMRAFSWRGRDTIIRNLRLFEE